MPARPVLQVHDALISYFDLSMIWDLNEFYYQAFTEYLYKITGVRYAFSVCFGMDYYNKCDSRNIDPDNLELVGSNRGILQILEGLDKIGVRYEIVEKDSDIVPVEEITMKKYNRNYGELVAYDEDVTKNRVVIKRLDPPRFYVPKLQY